MRESERAAERALLTTHRAEVQVDLNVECVRHPSPLKGSGEEVVEEDSCTAIFQAVCSRI